MLAGVSGRRSPAECGSKRSSGLYVLGMNQRQQSERFIDELGDRLGFWVSATIFERPLIEAGRTSEQDVDRDGFSGHLGSLGRTELVELLLARLPVHTSLAVAAMLEAPAAAYSVEIS